MKKVFTDTPAINIMPSIAVVANFATHMKNEL